MFFDMPLNSEPPVLDAAGLREKRALAEEKACTDFALWGGLTPGNLDKLEELAARGVVGRSAGPPRRLARRQAAAGVVAGA